MAVSAKDKIFNRLVEQLDLAAGLRDSIAENPETAAGRKCLRAWQAQRLARTHADLLTNPRFRETALFFLSDIYGPEDLNRHEPDVRRILPIMTKVLPAAGLETVADAVELNTLSEILDAAMIVALGSEAATIDEAAYGRAYRKIGRRRQRERQIDLIEHLGRSLDHLTQQPFVGKALSMMRKPAVPAGLGELQHFLERGYDAFCKMGGADEFLQIVISRERALLEALFADDDSMLERLFRSQSS